MAISFLLLSCNTARTVVENSTSKIIFAAGPKTIVYSTNKDYSHNVPVTMNAEHNRIISYPAPTDIYYQGKLAYPTPLDNGYWLDNRGINKNTVFLSYTYEEYAKLTSVPSLDELLKKVISRHPFEQLWDCGIRTQYKNETKELNRLIHSQFKGCVSLLPSIGQH